MTSADQTFTSLGALSCSYVDGVRAHRIGFRPSSWEWTPWECATGGRFTRPLGRSGLGGRESATQSAAVVSKRGLRVHQPDGYQHWHPRR